jgi:CRP/FNR family transcriptional regulator
VETKEKRGNVLRVNALATAIREELLSADGVRKLVLSRRASVVFSSGSPANHVFFLESGLVKLERGVNGSREILLAVVAPGEIFGEQALTGEGAFSTSARVLESGLAWSIPADTFLRLCERRPDVWRLVVQHCVSRSEALEKKIEHLCHSDVRERLIFYLGELARLTPGHDPAGSVIHISQNELASLVGATRETTSTTLNSLARQGLVALGHRLVMIPSLDLLREAGAGARAAKSATAAAAPQG